MSESGGGSWKIVCLIPSDADKHSGLCFTHPYRYQAKRHADCWTRARPFMSHVVLLSASSLVKTRVSSQLAFIHSCVSVCVLINGSRLAQHSWCTSWNILFTGRVYFILSSLRVCCHFESLFPWYHGNLGQLNVLWVSGLQASSSYSSMLGFFFLRSLSYISVSTVTFYFI